MGVHPDFAHWLNHYLAHHQRSLNWLARQLKRNPSTVNRWSTGETLPGDAQTVKAILDAFGIQDTSERQFFFKAAGYFDPDQSPPTAHAKSPVNPAPATPLHDFVAYDQKWVGRETLVQELCEQVQTARRLLVIVGMAGIGKTALAERLAVALTSWLQLDLYPITRLNFDHQTHGTDFATVAIKWLAEWGKVVTPEERLTPLLLLRRILQGLGKQRRLILIDALEKVVAGDAQTGQSALADEWWARFFHDLLAAETLQGRVIVTTQDLPVQLAKFGAEYPNRWLRTALGGLEESEQQALFQRHGLYAHLDSPATQLLARIGKIYAGHPLALRAIAGEIIQDYGANVLAYWREFGHEIERVERDLTEVQQAVRILGADDDWRLDRYSMELRRQVRHRLDGTLERLRQQVPDAYLLICTAAEYRGPVKARFWLGQLGVRGKSEQQQRDALQALRDRSLIEQSLDSQGNRLFALHNLMRSVALDHHSRLFPKATSQTEQSAAQ